MPLKKIASWAKNFLADRDSSSIVVGKLFVALTVRCKSKEGAQLPAVAYLISRALTRTLTHIHIHIPIHIHIRIHRCIAQTVL